MNFTFIKLSISLAAFTSLLSCKNQAVNIDNSVIASGQMPTLAMLSSGKANLVYGTGDSIMLASSSDNGNAFSGSNLIAVLPGLAASHTRGPQVAETADDELLVTACNNSGDIFSYKMNKDGKWTKEARVNDTDTVAKENLMALAADGNNAFAVWLDLRDKNNKIFGAKSVDGGKTWSKNSLVYSSPDTTVCECCKPSVAIKGNDVYVMFRNWLGGNRDLYLVQSRDGGQSFGQAQKLGNESWKLKGCPMDGGAVVINNNGDAQTVWNRKGSVYACEPGKPEEQLGEGRSCTMTTVNGKNVYAWEEKGEVVVLKPQGVKTTIGKGKIPVLRALNNEHVLCVWEDNKQIHKTIIEL